MIRPAVKSQRYVFRFATRINSIFVIQVKNNSLLVLVFLAHDQI